MRRLGAGMARGFRAGRSRTGRQDAGSRAGRPRLRRGAVVSAVAALAGASLAAAAASAATAAPGRAAVPAAQAAPAVAAPVCQVAYTVNSDWGTGFSIAITLTNNGPAITSWTLGYAYTGNQKIAQGWSGNWSQSGENITVTNASWNGALATGGSTQIGANFSYTGTNTAPTTFTLNGITCSGTGTPSPSPTPTSPSPSPTPTSPSPTPTGGPAPQLHVSGNKLLSSTGAQVVLHGVDRSGTEYACVQGNGIFDGPNDQASISAMKAWGVNAVRVPLNEACWNAESYVNAAYAGANYQNAIKAYVSLLNSNGMAAILDLHWTDGAYTGPSAGCSSAQAVCQKPMPDAAQAVPFWTSVAQAFKGNNAVIFDLFNEPYASRATGSATSGWQCWLNGGTCPGISYQVAGMQSLVNAVRSTGASNVIMLGGEEYANDLGTPGSTSDPSILSFLPTDPDHDLAVSWHSYNFNTCSSQSCWTSQVAPVIAQVPVIAGEIGENDCADGYVNPLMTWLDSESTSYLAWAWNADFNCSSGPGLISDYTGTPTGYGAGVKTHLQSLAGG
jgi:endoglucanase